MFYRWRRRYEDEGLDGLKDRFGAPLHCPTATRPEVVGTIIHPRQYYRFGPLEISMYLQRYRDVSIGRSAVWRILKRPEMNRLPASQRYQHHKQWWKRYEKQRPGHHVQVDVEFIEPSAPAARERDLDRTATAAPPP